MCKNILLPTKKFIFVYKFFKIVQNIFAEKTAM